MAPTPKEKIVTIRFSDSEFDQLRKAAESIDVTVSAFIREGALMCAKRDIDREGILGNRGGDNIQPGSYMPLVSQNEFLALLEKHNKLAQVSRESALAADREIEDLKQRVRVLEEKGKLS